jgi:hypothetical protein
MSEPVGFFEEGTPGNKSINRLMCFLSFLTSVVCATVTIMAATPNMVHYYVTLTFLGFAVAGKNAGKLIEMGFSK